MLYYFVYRAINFSLIEKNIHLNNKIIINKIRFIKETINRQIIGHIDMENKMKRQG